VRVTRFDRSISAWLPIATCTLPDSLAPSAAVACGDVAAPARGDVRLRVRLPSRTLAVMMLDAAVGDAAYTVDVLNTASVLPAELQAAVGRGAAVLDNCRYLPVDKYVTVRGNNAGSGGISFRVLLSGARAGCTVPVVPVGHGRPDGVPSTVRAG